MTGETLDGNAIREIVGLAEEAADYRFINEPGTGAAILLDNHGEIKHRVDPSEENAAESITGFCELFANMLRRCKNAENAIITITEAGIMGRCDADKMSGTGTVWFPLSSTMEWETLNRWYRSNGEKFNQKELIKKIRKSFPDSPMMAEVIPTIRTVKFTANSESSQTVVHSGDELSNTAKRAAVGIDGGGIAEFSALSANRFIETASDIVAIFVSVAIDIDMENKEFELCPLPNEIRKGTEATIQHIGASVLAGMNDSYGGVVDIEVITNARQHQQKITTR